MPAAALDLGSSSALLLVLDDDGTTLVDEVRVVGLGRGLVDGGALAPDRVAAALDVLADYARIAAAHGVPPAEVRAVATSAARRAADGAAFAEAVRARTGLPLRVITGTEEAGLTRRGALSDVSLLPMPGAVALVVDIGGGSTELALSTGPTASLEVGTIRLTERFLGTDVHDASALPWLQHAVDEALGTVALPPVDVVIAVAATATTLAALRLGLDRVDGRVHGARLGRDAVTDVVAALLPCTPAQRRRVVDVAPERADYLVAGGAILDAVLRHAGVGSAVVSARDLRHGLLLPLPGTPGGATSGTTRA